MARKSIRQRCLRNISCKELVIDGSATALLGHSPAQLLGRSQLRDSLRH